MQDKSKYIVRFRVNITFVSVVMLGLNLMLSGCVKPAASSSFLEKGPKGPELATENQQNSTVEIVATEPTSPPRDYSDLVKKYSERYHLDWPLALAVMKQESQFDREAVSYAGAYGLMQIMPITQSELVDKLGVSDAATPRNNIRAGVYHLRSMFRSFPKATGEDRIELALAAYNAGLTRIMAARGIARYLGQDPNSWEVVKKTLPLLSHSYYSLHRDIWHADKPPCGYFGGYRQTVMYVENIMHFYNDYSLALK
jgi:membrane-bound lytic murein transglycosylase MltF